MEISALQDVLISLEPLEDVMVGMIREGDVATALCFVPEAQTQAGDTGSAVRIEAGQDTGYVPVTNFPPDPADRTNLFDVGEDALRTKLPTCSST
ncbi:hypothetical protein ASH00_02665 [Arthrobacter sp. Soil782]|uniref:hypothetical protein n=1 Tax=Arthrobacter sp. Soil782 TaxID=1736410 RepID=UPI0006FCFFA6|nr:hypothetical protein [Arthrobacter sp. Soil782]KRF08622.1 hypothetical protein ASH00_02665 [Arthrobacter sp. Soil782]